MEKNEKQSHSNNSQADNDKNKCGATAKSTGNPCQLPAGFGTSHVGEGRCKYHGGEAGAPEGNKNARKAGVYEDLVKDRLSEDEKEVYDNVNADTSLREELKILRFKLLRLLDPIEIEKVVTTKESVEKVAIECDEITKIDAIGKLADKIRKIVKQMKREGKDTSSLDDLIITIAESRKEE